jgi:hypothetical protein
LSSPLFSIVSSLYVVVPYIIHLTPLTFVVPSLGK